MAKNKKILTIENIFIPKGYSKTRGGFWPTSHISIPFLSIYQNNKTALYIPNDNENITFHSLSKFILKDNKAVMTYYNPKTKEYYDFNKHLNFTTRKKDILAKLSYFNIDEIVDQDDLKTPLYELWDDCQNSIKSVINLDNLSSIYSNLDYTMKNLIFNILKNHSSNLMDTNNEFIKTLQGLEQSILATINQKDQNTLASHLENLTFIINSYIVNTIKEYFEIFKGLKNEYRRLEEGIQTSNINEQKNLIEQSKTKLSYMNKINNVSLLKVENDLKIRDLNSEIAYYKDLKNSIIKYSRKTMYYQINLIRKEIKLLEQKKKLLDIINDEYFDLLKDILIKKKESHIWSKNFKKLQYLNEQQLEDLKLMIDSEISIFITNNFTETKDKYKNATVSKIKEFINQEFSFNIKPYITMSKNMCDQLNENIAAKQSAISEIKNRRFNHLSNYKNIVSVHELEEKIKYAQAELDWSKYSEEKLFNSLLKSKEFKLNRIKLNVRKTEKIVCSIINSLLTKVPLLHYEGVIKLLNEFNKFLTKNWIFDLLMDLINYSSNKQKAGKKFLKDSAAMIRFIESFETASVSIPNYIKPFKDLDVIDKAKIKLTKFGLTKIEVLIVQDNMQNIAEEARSEFLRVLFKIVEANNISTVFITSNLKFIKETMDYVYFFNDIQLLEGAKVKELFAHPVNPDVNLLINHKIASLNQQLNRNYVQLFIKQEIYTLDSHPSHFVYCTLSEYQKWNMINTNNQTGESERLFSDEKLSDTKINEEFQSVFVDDEFILSDLDVKLIPEPYDKDDNQFTTEIKLSAHSKDGHNVSEIISPEVEDKLF
ncbi:MAG1360 family OppF-related protein [Mycoplasma sp. 005V]|uniref:MAG1360 family OppF-related protein n=1 Tax=unclassified Mycoplasma TaxID=2683645 RepID=UPI003A894B17